MGPALGGTIAAVTAVFTRDLGAPPRRRSVGSGILVEMTEVGDLDANLDAVLIGGREERVIRIEEYSEEWRRFDAAASPAVPNLTAWAYFDGTQ